MEGPEPCLRLPDVCTNAKILLEQKGIREQAGYITCTQNSPQTHENIRTKGHMRVISYITSTKKTHLKLTKTLKVCRAK